MADLKGQYWEVTVYPENLPEDWKEKIERLGLPCLLSPLHDRDTFQKDDAKRGIKKGDLKKAHYHLLICWKKGTTTLNNVLKIAEPFGSTLSNITKIMDPYGCYEYYDHHNEQEKAQYDKADYQYFCGWDPINYYKALKSENIQARRAIQQSIKEFGIKTYFELMEVLDEAEEDELAEYASKHTIYFKEYIYGYVKKYIRSDEKILKNS